jgi:hypothetical protein
LKPGNAARGPGSFVLRAEAARDLDAPAFALITLSFPSEAKSPTTIPNSQPPSGHSQLQFGQFLPDVSLRSL